MVEIQTIFELIFEIFLNSHSVPQERLDMIDLV